ncbi:hypothetical protein PV08_01663 [Exophiala spinifera]|uniref:Uncharacterized protein n=1 Tax=Exophiala spinifera TaxID=91928 RepID=A0A0D2CC80_9EURO|nr:uncharacterized protein PV08_01663 [Exophiala spinifera]KIW21084.1 hypothetical protein PV08_01663 [Exophiala spinifera]
MLALQRKSSPAGSCTANILPCRIHHDGPTKVTKRYWSPRDEKDQTKTAYFRGRRLRGRVIAIPQGYHGVVARSTDRYLPQPPKPRPTYTAVDEDIEIEDEEEEPPEPVKVLEEVTTFDDVIVWGHDQVPSQDDAFVKGLEEWISFAEAIHGKPRAADTDKPQQAGTESAS